MNWRNFLIVILIGMLLIVFVCEVAHGEEDEDDYQTAPFNATVGARTKDVHQGDTVFWNETVDLRKVCWEGCVFYREGDEHDLIDASSFTVRIFIDPNFWTPGEYHQWSDYDEPHGNTLAFFVEKYNWTPAVNETSEAFTGVNETFVQRPVFPLEGKNLGDILIARGDELHYRNDGITNASRVWIFGRVSYLYNISWSHGELYIPSRLTGTLEAGYYTVIIDQPGPNTITEALFDEREETIRSKFYDAQRLRLFTYSKDTNAAAFKQWLRENTDDEITEMTLVVQDPLIEIMTFDRQRSAVDSIRLEGYTNLKNQSILTVTLDEDVRTKEILAREKFTTAAIEEAPGSMRQWSISVPFDEGNATLGWHVLTVRGALGAEMPLWFTVSPIPEGQERPSEYYKVVGGNIYIPTPTPVVVVNESVRTVEKVRIETRTETVVEKVDYGKLAETLVVTYGLPAVVLILLGRIALKAYVRKGKEKRGEP